MDRRPRKSTLGTHGVPPIRMNLSPPRRSPLGSGTSPRPKRFGATRTSPRLGSCKSKRVSPIRVGDLSAKDLSYFLSSKKKPKLRIPTINVPVKSRRCLYKDSEGTSNSRATSSQIPASKRNVGPIKASGVNYARPTQESKIPLPGSLSKNRTGITFNKAMPVPCVLSSKKVPKTSTVTSGQSKNVASEAQTESHNQLVQLMHTVSAEQKAMLAEAKEIFGAVLQEQRSILQEMRQLHDAHQKLFQSQEFNILERNFQNQYESKAASSVFDHTREVVASEPVSNESSKENSVCHPSRKSLVAYKEMRKSFRCLNTPTLSCKKPRTPKVKTPRSALSAKVKAQLECLLDE